MALDRPVNAPEAADGATAPAVAPQVAPASVAHGDVVQRFIPPPPPPPPPPDFGTWLAGGKS